MREGATFVALGSALRKLREQKGLTLEAVAETAGISPSSLSRLESETFRPKLETLERILEGLRADILDLGFALRQAQGHTCSLTLPEGLSAEERAALTLTAYGFERFVLSLAGRSGG